MYPKPHKEDPMNPHEKPTEIIVSLIGMLISIGGLILMGYIHGKMNIGAVIENLG